MGVLDRIRSAIYTPRPTAVVVRTLSYRDEGYCPVPRCCLRAGHPGECDEVYP